MYRFSATGRHLSTVDVLTGATLYSFGYDAGGRLVAVTDRVGDMTTIERDSLGAPTAVVSPYGERTTLVVNGDGNLERIISPDGNDAFASQLGTRTRLFTGIFRNHLDANLRGTTWRVTQFSRRGRPFARFSGAKERPGSGTTSCP